MTLNCGGNYKTMTNTTQMYNKNHLKSINKLIVINLLMIQYNSINERIYQIKLIKNFLDMFLSCFRLNHRSASGHKEFIKKVHAYSHVATVLCRNQQFHWRNSIQFNWIVELYNFLIIWFDQKTHCYNLHFSLRRLNLNKLLLQTKIILIAANTKHIDNHFHECLEYSLINKS